jgi:hypothetical protein
VAASEGIDAALADDDDQKIRRMTHRVFCELRKGARGMTENLLIWTPSRRPRFDQVDRVLSIIEEALEYAQAGKRHWLTSPPGPEIHTRQDDPSRMDPSALAAAILYAYGDLPGARRGQIANEIAAAMARGGFLVKGGRENFGKAHAPSGRWVIENLAWFLGKRKRRGAPSDYWTKVFAGWHPTLREEPIRSIRKAKTPSLGLTEADEGKLKVWLTELEEFCRSKIVLRPLSGKAKVAR